MSNLHFIIYCRITLCDACDTSGPSFEAEAALLHVLRNVNTAAMILSVLLTSHTGAVCSIIDMDVPSRTKSAILAFGDVVTARRFGDSPSYAACNSSPQVSLSTLASESTKQKAVEF